jgi:histone acetyltransferase 1
LEDEERKLVGRLQILVPFFIDGGIHIDMKDTKWQTYILYNHERKAEQVIGFVTCYPFLYFPDKTRLRISQFFIMPLYQNVGHGRYLYTELMQLFRKNEKVVEVTVEDPNDAFTRLRDGCDESVVGCDGLVSNSNVTRMNLKETVSILAKKYKLTFVSIIKIDILILMFSI